MRYALLMFVLTGLLAGAVAYGDVTNVRPFGPLGDNGFEDTLQEVFDGIKVSGPGIDALNNQTPYALFTNDASGGSVATFVIELADNAPSQMFGLYQASNPGNKAQVFAGSAGSGDQALISFFANGDVKVNGSPVASSFFGPFGFYLESPGLGMFYSQDSLNDGTARALIYQGDGLTKLQIQGFAAGLFSRNEFIVAFEDGTDSDFQDLVVLVESITPVIPAPAGIALAAIGLGLIAWSRRRRA